MVCNVRLGKRGPQISVPRHLQGGGPSRILPLPKPRLGVKGAIVGKRVLKCGPRCKIALHCCSSP